MSEFSSTNASFSLGFCISKCASKSPETKHLLVSNILYICNNIVERVTMYECMHSVQYTGTGGSDEQDFYEIENVSKQLVHCDRRLYDLVEQRV